MKTSDTAKTCPGMVDLTRRPHCCPLCRHNFSHLWLIVAGGGLIRCGRPEMTLSTGQRVTVDAGILNYFHRGDEIPGTVAEIERKPRICRVCGGGQTNNGSTCHFCKGTGKLRDVVFVRVDLDSPPAPPGWEVWLQETDISPNAELERVR